MEVYYPVQGRKHTDGSVGGGKSHSIGRRLEHVCRRPIQYENGIVAKQWTVNLLHSEERDATQNVTRFQYLTSYSITDRRAEEIQRIGRSRWKIENEGFQRQKEHRYYIGHAFSKNYRAMKNHYLLVQLADILMQLYEHRAAVWKRTPCQIEEISSLLLTSISSRFLTKKNCSTRETDTTTVFLTCSV